MEPLSALGWLVIFIILVVILYRYGTQSARNLEAVFPGLDGPKPWPFIGNMPGMINAKMQLHLFLEMNIKKYGRLYSMTFAGLPSLITTDPQMIKEICVKQFDCFHDRPVSVLPPIADIFTRIFSIVTQRFHSHTRCRK